MISELINSRVAENESTIQIRQQGGHLFLCYFIYLLFI